LSVDELDHALDLLWFWGSEIGDRLEHVHDIRSLTSPTGNRPYFHPHDGPNALTGEKEKVMLACWPLRPGKFAL
jgi:hypothetical protein